MVYKFQNKNLETCEENLNYKPNLSFMAYFDFKTTTTPSEMINPENNKMFAISYVIIYVRLVRLPQQPKSV